MSRYKLIKDVDLNVTDVIVNDGTHPTLPEGACIPAVVGDRDYDEYLVWEEENDADAADTIDYMEMMRVERDIRLKAADWRVHRNYQQVTNSDTPSDDASKMGDVYDYMQALRDMPEDHTGTDTKTEYEALTWPTEPE